MDQRVFSIQSGLDADLEFKLKKIDREHVQIFSLVRKFYDLLRFDVETPYIPILLQKIIMLIRMHSQTEEDLLKQWRISELAAEIKAHRLILNELTRIHQGLLTDDAVFGNDLFHIFDSLIAHQLREDHQLHLQH